MVSLEGHLRLLERSHIVHARIYLDRGAPTIAELTLLFGAIILDFVVELAHNFLSTSSKPVQRGHGVSIDAHASLSKHFA